MTTNQFGHAIGTFATREDAEYAMRELQDAGFNMDRVSVIAKNPEPRSSIGGAEVKSAGKFLKIEPNITMKCCLKVDI